MITAEHFGINYVADFEKVGAKSWMVFDELANLIRPYSIRYPGGSTAELWIDIRNPTASSYVTPDGVVRNITNVSDFIKFCAGAGYKAEIIIPMKEFLNSAAYGKRSFDLSDTAALEQYIRYCLQVSGPQAISKFSLGNEYESYMTSSEYGRLVNYATPVINRVLAEYSGADAAGNAFGPEISIQSWIMSAQGSLTSDELLTRNAQVIKEISPSVVRLIDGVEGHYYFLEGRGAGFPEEHYYYNIDKSVNLAYRILGQWESLTGGRVKTSISEWNVQHATQNYSGLAQIAPMLSMFSAFVGSGVDAMTFWSMQYHITSAGTNNGKLTPAGALLQWMGENLVGTDVSEDTSGVWTSAAGGDVFTFEDAMRRYIIITSNDPTPTTATLDLLGDLFGYTVIGLEKLTIDMSKADGLFKGNPTPINLEADIPSYFEEIEYEISAEGFAIAANDAFGTIAFELKQQSDEYLFYTSGNDFVRGAPNPDGYSLGSGDDTFVGAGATAVVGAGSGNDYVSTNGDRDVVYGGGGDDYISTGSGADSVLGGDGNDTIFSGTGSDTISGGSGNDAIYGRSSADNLKGGEGDDSLFGDDGNDEIAGEQGNDYIVGGAGNDSISGGDGDDKIYANDGYNTIYGGSGNDFVESGCDADEIYGGWGNDTLNGGAGFDFIYGESGSDAIFGGGGNDALSGGDDCDEIFGGTGNDFIHGDRGNDTLHGEGGADILFGGLGSDVFVFLAYSIREADLISDFQKGLDLIEIRNSGRNTDTIGEFDIFISQVESDFTGVFSVGLDLDGNGSIDFEILFRESLSFQKVDVDGTLFGFS